jgi:hypothetical protein
MKSKGGHMVNRSVSIRAPIALALVCMLGTAAGAAADPATALLRIHSTYQGGAHGFTYYDQDFCVSRQRATTAVLTQNYISSPLPLGWQTFHIATTASPQAFQTLQQSFEENHVGAQDGVCSVTGTVGPFTGFFEVTWYGRGVRRAMWSIEVNAIDPSPPCGAEVVRLYRAIQAFAFASGVLGLGPGLQP